MKAPFEVRQNRISKMKSTEKQKPNLSVAAAPKATKIFVRPGMHFRPE
jgi:hypothetical protein